MEFFVLAVKKVLANKEKLMGECNDLKLNKIKMSEWKFLVEFCSVIEPLAMALDKL